MSREVSLARDGQLSSAAAAAVAAVAAVTDLTMTLWVDGRVERQLTAVAVSLEGSGRAPISPGGAVSTIEAAPLV